MKSLSETQILFTNYGNKSIRRHDFLKDDMLRIEVESELLNVQFNTTSKLSKTFEITRATVEDKSILYLSFDALARGQGFYIKLLHDGNIKSDITVCGNIDNVKKIKSRYDSPTEKSWLELILIAVGNGYLFYNLLVGFELLGTFESFKFMFCLVVLVAFFCFIVFSTKFLVFDCIKFKLCKELSNLDKELKTLHL